MCDDKAQSLLTIHSDEVQALLVLGSRDADFAVVACPFLHLLAKGVEYRNVLEACAANGKDIVDRIGEQGQCRVVFTRAKRCFINDVDFKVAG